LKKSESIAIGVVFVICILTASFGKGYNKYKRRMRRRQRRMGQESGVEQTVATAQPIGLISPPISTKTTGAPAVFTINPLPVQV